MRKMFFLLLFIAAFSVNASAQKMMMLNDSLRANSEVLPIKIRGGSMLKFDFGIYKTISAKAGWSTTRSKSKLFSGKEESASEQNSSIEIVANGKDTSTIHVALNIKEEAFRERGISFSRDRAALEREENSSKLKQEKNLAASISTSIDTTTWSFVYIHGFDIEKPFGQEKANGFLSDGNRNIEIKNVTKWDNGKSPALYSKVGYELYLDGKIVAAVQDPVDTFQKKYIWLKNDLDDYIKLILASTAVLLLSYGSTMPQ